MDSATAITGCKLLQIGKKEMMLALHRGHAFSELFVARLLARNIRYHESLVGKIFDSGEIRLARVLLLLAHFGKEDAPADVIPELSQEALASMSYTTSAHAGQIMNNFYKAGFLTYRKGKIQIDRTLLNVVLCDSSSRLTLTSKSPRA
jgi:CRP-like cAMP-binding protein